MTIIATDGDPEGRWMMEHSDTGGTPWVRIRARGSFWSVLTPTEALEIADKIIERYRAEAANE